jgi:hypothetical protein
MEDTLIRALSESNLLESRNAIAVISGGVAVRSPGEGILSDESLLLTYELRLDHIRKFSSAHARRLAAAMAEFVAILRTSGSKGGSWYTVKADAECQFTIFKDRSGRVIACLPVISKTEVSEARWQELWGVQDAQQAAGS